MFLYFVFERIDFLALAISLQFHESSLYNVPGKLHYDEEEKTFKQIF